jgi:hypothetical protein
MNLKKAILNEKNIASGDAVRILFPLILFPLEQAYLILTIIWIFLKFFFFLFLI